MRFALTDEQELLSDTARAWADETFGADAARRAHDGSFDLATAWKGAVELGWPSLRVPEAVEGMGATVVEAAVVLEAAARGLCPLPLLGHSLAVAAANAWGDDRLLAHAAAGEPLTLALDPSMATISAGPDGVVLGHTPQPIIVHASPDGDLRAADGAEVEPLTASVLPGLLGWVSGLPQGAGLADGPAERWLAESRVLLAAAMLGHAGRALDLAVEHVGGRVQFGRPVGSFQAIHHLLADALVDVETCRSVTYGAAWSAVHDPARGGELAAAAFTWVAERALAACETALQAHGGIGFTWECEVHLHLRPVLLLGALLGGGPRAAEDLGDAVLSGTWGG